MGRDIKQLFVFYDHEYKMLVSAIAVEENGEIASLEQTNCTRTRFRSNIIFSMVFTKMKKLLIVTWFISAVVVAYGYLQFFIHGVATMHRNGSSLVKRKINKTNLFELNKVSVNKYSFGFGVNICNFPLW